MSTEQYLICCSWKWR